MDSMAHPDVVPADDPYLARVRDLALSLPGAQEKRSVGQPTFFTTKVFLWVGMSYKVDGEWKRDPHSVSVLLPQDEREAVLALPDTFIPGYIGPSGWVGVALHEGTDWQEIAELIEESYRQTAPQKLIAELENR